VCGLEKEASEFPPYSYMSPAYFVCIKCKNIKANTYLFFYTKGIKKSQAPTDLVEAVEQYYRLSQELSVKKEALNV